MTLINGEMTKKEKTVKYVSFWINAYEEGLYNLAENNFKLYPGKYNNLNYPFNDQARNFLAWHSVVLDMTGNLDAHL